ncbi:MAG: hypothetical protein AB7O49_06600 [Sphingomonadales bacterium]
MCAVSVISVLAALAAPAAAADSAGAAGQTDAAPAADQPLAPAPGGDVLNLLCKGTYYFQNTGAVANSAPATTQTQATQFSIKISYAGQYMDMVPSEWPALMVSKDNPSVVRSVKFSADDDMVRAMFAPASGNELQGTLRNMGLSKLAGDYKEIITLNRKTGDFTYPNTTGRCDKVEAAVKENKF